MAILIKPMFEKLMSIYPKDRDRIFERIILCVLTGTMIAMLNAHYNDTEEIKSYRQRFFKARWYLTGLCFRFHTKLTEKSLKAADFSDYHFKISEDEKVNTLLSRCLNFADKENEIVFSSNHYALFKKIDNAEEIIITEEKISLSNQPSEGGMEKRLA